MEIQGFDVDTSVISVAEAELYIETYRSRMHPRRIQAWFDHCARIRHDPKAGTEENRASGGPWAATPR